LLEEEYRSYMVSDDNNDIAHFFVCDMPHDWRYEKCFFEQLYLHVDKAMFWEAAFTSQSAFGELWDDNTDFTSFEALFEAIKLSYFAMIIELNSPEALIESGDRIFLDTVTGFEQHAELDRRLFDELRYMHNVIIHVEQGDDSQFSYAHAFFENVASFEYEIWMTDFDWYFINVVLTPLINYLNANVPKL